MNKKSKLSLGLLMAIALATPFSQRLSRGKKTLSKKSTNSRSSNYPTGGQNGLQEMARRRKQIAAGTLRKENGLCKA